MKPQRISHRVYLIIGLLFFTGFLLSILIGKMSLLLGAAEPIYLGNVGEFVCLLAAVVFLMIFVISNTAGPQAERSSGES